MNIENRLRLYTAIGLLIIGYSTTSIFAQPLPPMLDCVDLQNSTSIVYWDYHPQSQCNGAGNFEEYVVYRSETPEGPFQEINASAADSPYEDNLTGLGTTSFYYYMTIRCGGQESASSDTIQNLRPEPPEIVRTTVNPDGTVTVAFLPSPNPNVSGYVTIVSRNGGQFADATEIPRNIDEITNINDTLYVNDLLAEADISSIGYTFRAFTCSETENTGLLADAHYTIFVGAEVDDCQDLVNLSWTPYIGWNHEEDGVLIDSVSSYTIFTEVDTTVVNAPITQLVYPIDPTVSNRCFRVVANNTTNLSSESNEACITRTPSNPPTDICLHGLTLDTLNNGAILNWTITPNEELTNVGFLRGGSPTNLQPIGSLADEDIEVTAFLDNEINMSGGLYYYQIVHTDDCNRQVFSNIGSTLHLTARNQLNATNLVNWTAFDLGESATVSGYTVYRSENIPLKNFVPIETTGGATLEFTDELNDVENPDGSFCYYVEAEYDIVCSDGTTSNDFSQSNQVCISQSPRMFVPNAFAPNGVNRIFKPILRNPNPNDYQMTVFNRWGQHVFSTNDPEQGWDGFHLGKLAPQGVYAYYIKMQTELGFTLERKGTVVLVR